MSKSSCLLYLAGLIDFVNFSYIIGLEIIGVQTLSYLDFHEYDLRLTGRSSGKFVSSIHDRLSHFSNSWYPVLPESRFKDFFYDHMRKSFHTRISLEGAEFTVVHNNDDVECRVLSEYANGIISIQRSLEKRMSDEMMYSDQLQIINGFISAYHHHLFSDPNWIKEDSTYLKNKIRQFMAYFKKKFYVVLIFNTESYGRESMKKELFPFISNKLYVPNMSTFQACTMNAFNFDRCSIDETSRNIILPNIDDLDKQIDTFSISTSLYNICMVFDEETDVAFTKLIANDSLLFRNFVVEED